MYEHDFKPEKTPTSFMPEKRESIESEGVYVGETRRDGCDIKRQPPEPKLLMGDNIEYLLSSAPENDREIRPDDALTAKNAFCSVFAFVKWTAIIIVVLWVVTVASPFIGNALTLHGWRFWASLLLGLLPVAFVLCLMMYVVLKFRRLPAIEQFDESDFQNKAELQRQLTSRYLSNFVEFDRYAFDCGFADADGKCDRSEVVGALQRLTGRNQSCYSDSRGWLADFRYFQGLQDARAKEIIGISWKLVAIKTAASPWKIVDMLAVVYNSTIMVTRLARIYNRRISGPEAFRLVCRWVVNIYIAGEAGDVTQGAVEWASANDLISSTYKPLAGLLGKIAEGGANAFLVYRLGCRAMEYFRPLTGK